MSTAHKNQTVRSIIVSLLIKYWYGTLLLVFAAAGTVAAGLVPPRIMKFLIDTCLSGSTTVSRPLIHTALWYFGSFALIALFEIVREAVLSTAGQKVTVVLRTTMMHKLTRLPAAYFTAHESGTTVSRFTNDIESIQTLFTNGIVGMAVDLLKVIGIIGSMWLFNPALGIFMLCIVPPVFLLTRFFQKRMLGAQKKKRMIIGRVSGFVPETIRTIRMIHSFNKETYMQQKYARTITESYNTIEKINLYDSIYSPIIRTICSFFIAAVALAAGAHLPFIQITAGIAAASIQYIMDVFTPIGNLGMELQSIQSALAGIWRTDEFLAEQEDPEKDPAAAALLLKQISAGEKVTIELRHVSFAYRPDSPKILDDVSLIIAPGERITFTGRTGAGKSTLFNLIPGLLTPQSGTVTLNNLDVSLLPNTDKRHLFGYVAQHFDFIEGTIADQIALGDTSITRAEIEDALRFSGLYDYIASLKNGMETQASARLFSQGQQELLAVARAIVTRPPILLLDEITAHLDSATEKELIGVLNRAGDGRTVLSVSHRLSMSLPCDRTITVAGGRLQ